MDGIDVLIVIVRALLAFTLLMLLTVLNVWAERKIVADFQNRLGPSASSRPLPTGSSCSSKSR